MNGTELTARFAFPPNYLNYCGPKNSSGKIFDFISNGIGKEKEIQLMLEKFVGLNSYLELIAQSGNLNKFDYSVGEAYWIGNSLLEKVPKEKIGAMVLTKFVGKNKLPKKIALTYSGRVNERILPHHSFHVFSTFFLNKQIEPVIESIDSCRIGWGRIIDAEEKFFAVEYNPIVWENEKLCFGKSIEKTVQNCVGGKKGKIADAVENDLIAFHWGFACKKISLKEEKQLEYYTEKNLIEAGK